MDDRRSRHRMVRTRSSIFDLQSSMYPCFSLPILVLRSVKRLAIALAVNIEDVFPAPRCRIRFVLVRPHAPIGIPCHRIDGKSAKEPDSILTRADDVGWHKALNK